MTEYFKDSRKLIKNDKFDEYLYHYTSLETALEYILPSEKIRLSSFDKCNAQLIFISDEEIDLNIDGKTQLMINNIVCKKTKVLYFSQDNKIKLLNLREHVNIELSRGYARPRMWF